MISEKGYARGAVFEACVLTMYPDSKNPAIGFGTNDPNLKLGDVTTLEHAIELYLAHAKTIEAVLDKLFAGVSLMQQHVDALFLLTYNVGAGTLTLNTELIDAVKLARASPDDKRLRDLAALELIKTHPDDKPMPFNLARRCAEATIFIKGDYGDLSTMQLWDAGKSPRNVPPDPSRVVPMPTFLKGAMT